ncbi:ATP-binding cassette domain-containing protein [Streptomyces sp. NPDC002763]|uniref:ATP-binding cassette domain-containing protein n=1 Tax=Streptomyces sp. NPDC002763 TaxID=3154427 RepID=UPI00332ECD95
MATVTPGRRAASLRQAVSRRGRLVAAARQAGSGRFCALWAVSLLRALLPTTTGLATGWLVSRLVASPHQRGTLVLAAAATCASMFATQLVDAFAPAVGFGVARRVDAWHRDRVAELMGRPAGIAHLTDPMVQDRLAAATMKGLPGWASYSFGTAAAGQIVIATRIVGACAAALVLAHFSWALAAGLLALTLYVRSVTRRQWLDQHAAVRCHAPATRRANYWADIAVLPWSAKETRIFGMADWVRGRFRHAMDERAAAVAGVRLRLVRRAGWTTLVMMAAVATVLAALAASAADGRTSPGELAVQLGALWGVVAVHGMDVEAFDVEFAGLPTLAALDDLSASAGPRRGPEAGPEEPFRGERLSRPPRVRCEGVGFRYAGSDRPVLTGLDLELPPGKLVAVVGANGAGKTTLIRLLTGMYEPVAGRITVDGVRLEASWMARWRRQVTIVSQDFIRYDLSLRENVTLGAPECAADEGLLATAAAQAGIGDLLGQAPAGWDTPLSSAYTSGVNLSGGQWQRVALARALYAVAAGARLLILDEPVAHLDIRAELATFRQVVAAARDTTIVLVSHRLATVRQADRIVLLDGGRITEGGSHDELMALGGTYAAMFTAQAERFAAETGEETHAAEAAAS